MLGCKKRRTSLSAAYRSWRTLLRVTGYLEREGIVVHLIAQKIEDLSHRLSGLGHPLAETIWSPTVQADEAPRQPIRPTTATARHPREQAKKLFPSRDFH